jgi:hypothetical protein
MTSKIELELKLKFIYDKYHNEITYWLYWNSTAYPNVVNIVKK